MVQELEPSGVPPFFPLPRTPTMSSLQAQLAPLIRQLQAYPLWAYPAAVVFLVAAYFLAPYFNEHGALRKYPGPLSAALSRMWLARTSRNGVRSMKVHELHQKHGKFVRIGPSEYVQSRYERISRTLRSSPSLGLLHQDLGGRPEGSFHHLRPRQRLPKDRFLCAPRSQPFTPKEVGR